MPMKCFTNRICKLLLTLFFTAPLFASDFVNELTIRDISLGSNTIGTNSPISLAGYHEIPNQVVLGYRNKFSMAETSISSVTGVYTSSFMRNSLSIASAGYEDYRETSVALKTQKLITEKLSIGIAIQSLSISSITLENSLWEIYPRIGLEYHLSPNITFGLNMDNPVRFGSNGLDRIDEKMKIALGSSYRIEDLLLFGGSYEWQNVAGRNRLLLGLELALIPDFKVRLGISSNPFTPAFGCGYTFKNLTIDITSEQQRYLGNSLSVGLTYAFNKK